MPEEIRTKLAYIKGNVRHNVPSEFLPKAIQVKAEIINQKGPVVGVGVKLLSTSSPQEYSLIVPPGTWEIWATIDGQESQRSMVTVEAGQTTEADISLG